VPYLERLQIGHHGKQGSNSAESIAECEPIGEVKLANHGKRFWFCHWTDPGIGNGNEFLNSAVCSGLPETSSAILLRLNRHCRLNHSNQREAGKRRGGSIVLRLDPGLHAGNYGRIAEPNLVETL